jgi:hypothetical protein
MGKQQKKWENGTKGLRFTKSVFFVFVLILGTILRKKKFYSKALKFQIKILEQLLVFGCFLARKRGPFTNVTVKLPKTREINHSKTFSNVKIFVLSDFEHKNFLRVCLHRLF